MNNQALFQRAQQTIPGGVNSPVRAFKSVGGTPRFMQKGEGAFLWDNEDKRYIDYIGSWGPMILGHAHPAVVTAIQQAVTQGLSFGTPTELEIELAELLCQRLPSLEQVRLVSSGTEATMSAIRLARGFTNRNKIIKFEGCYHGHADSLLVKAGSGLLTFGAPTSAGVPPEFVQYTQVLNYNDCEQLTAAFKEYGSQIACVIIEPIAGNMNLVQPGGEFLQLLRKLCSDYGSVLIFDEVMTGFRVGPQGAQGLYNITPDLTTLGKIIGGGMPVGAFGGRKDIMAHLAPLGNVYQAGTLSGNPIAVTSGLTTLKLIDQPGFFEQLSQQTKNLVDGLKIAAKQHDIAFNATSIGGMFGIYFQENIPKTYAQVMQTNTKHFNQFFHAMLDLGVYLAPSAFEAGFVSIMHTNDIISETIEAANQAFSKLD